jgi:hypothetical protein
MAPFLLFRSTRDDLKLLLLTNLIAENIKSVRLKRMDKNKLQKSAFQYERKGKKTHEKIHVLCGGRQKEKKIKRKKLVINKITFAVVILFFLNP